MANAVFNSYEDYLSKDTSNPVQHNSFDLSHIRNFTTTYGALIPFYLEDCVPSDHFKISNIVKVQSLPMANPLFNNIKITTWYFYCPYYLLWRKFDLFISGGRDGTYTADFPVTSLIPTHNSLGDYLGLPIPPDYTSSGTLLSVSAFPFAMYQRIYRDYFFNQDLQTSTNTNYWFPADEDDFTLRDGTSFILSRSSFASRYYNDVVADHIVQSGSGYYGQDFCVDTPGTVNSSRAVTSTETREYPILQLIRFKNFNRDYFTSAMFSPQRGPAMGLTSTNLSPFSPSDFNTLTSISSSTASVSDTISTGYMSSSDPSSYGFFQSSSTSGISNGTLNQSLANLSNIISKRISSAITISDIMTASQVQLWMERNMQVKAQYNEFLRVHFGDAPLDERLTKPYYIGGSTQYLNVSAVVQTSESANTPQGTMTGLGSGSDSQFIGSFTSHEYGMIMGIMCIMPDVYYTQGLDRIWSHSTKFDFYFPEFAQLPPEPIYNREIWYDNRSNNHNDEVFGYAGRYDFMRHRRSMSVSDLRNPNMLDFSSWVVNRSFSSLPTLNSQSFLSSLKDYGGIASIPARIYNSSGVWVDYNNIPMDHFPTGNLQNPFLVQVGLNIHASRPLPFRNEPQTLNLRRG